MSTQNNPIPPTLPQASIRSFLFKNSAGGTQPVKAATVVTGHDLAQVNLCYAAENDEIGWIFRGTPTDPEVLAFLETKGSQPLVYFSESDLAQPSTANQLVHQLGELATVVRTYDGYTFLRKEDGSWGDGDMTFASFAQMVEDVQLVVDLSQ